MSEYTTAYTTTTEGYLCQTCQAATPGEPSPLHIYTMKAGETWVVVVRCQTCGTVASY